MLTMRYPARFFNSSEFEQFQIAIAEQTEAMRADYEDFRAQLHVSTATWGLSSWEEALGLDTDVSKSDTFRRTRIMSKLRGSGTTTAELIRTVAASFSGGEVEVTEVNAEYRFIVKFIGQIGAPPNMNDVTAALEEIKPAHLACTYEYTYLLISDIEGVMTLAELETQTLDKFAGGS